MSNNKNYIDKDELEYKYCETFGDFPPLLMMMSYNHPMYQKLMKKALKTGIPITADDIENEIKKKNIKYDMN